MNYIHLQKPHASPCFDLVIRVLQWEGKVPVRLKALKWFGFFLYLHDTVVRHLWQAPSCYLLQLFFGLKIFFRVDKNVSCPIKQLSHNELKSSVVTMEILEESRHHWYLLRKVVFKMNAPFNTNGLELVEAVTSSMVGYLYGSVCHAWRNKNCFKKYSQN